MNSEPPPIKPSKPPGPLSLQRYGCLVIIVVIVALIILGVFALRYAVLETAVPFKAVASVFESADPNVKITGVTGSLATGPSVASITWGADPAHRSEILDLRVKYNGFADFRKNKRVIIEDLGVRKAHIDLTDLAAKVQTSGQISGPGRQAPSESRSASTFPEGLDSIEIRRVLIEDVLITNRRSEFQLSIPKVEWTGFKATRQGVEAGELHIDSDRLTLHTGPGGTHPLGGETVTFEKSLTGTLQPLLHAAIQQPLSFTADFTFIPEVKAPAFFFSALAGKVELATTADGGHALQVRQLDLPALLDVRKLYGPEAAEFPGDLVLEAAAASDDGPMKIGGGSFRLGVTTFHIEPVEIAAANRDNAVVQAVARMAAGEIRWSLPLKEVPMHFRPRLTARPELPPTEILAQVFAGKTSAELNAEEKRAIDARMPAYFAPPSP